MDESIQIIGYTAEYRDSLIDLQRYLWGPDPQRNARYFDWKYRDNPFSDQTMITMILDGDRVVGMYGSSIWLWEAGRPSKPMKCITFGDLVIHPEFRRRKLSARLKRVMYSGHASGPGIFGLALSSNMISRIGYARMGWERIHEFRELFARSAPRLSLNRWVSSKRPFRTFDRWLGQTAGTAHVSDEARPVEMAELVSRIPHDGRIRVLRNEGYFAWRFRNPLADYRFIFHGKDTLEGYMVLHSEPGRTSGRVSMVDWEAIDARVAGKLLSTAMDIGKFSELHVWRESVAPRFLPVLQKAGFAEKSAAARGTRFHPIFLLWQIAGADPIRQCIGSMDWREMGSWDIRMAYSDGY